MPGIFKSGNSRSNVRVSEERQRLFSVRGGLDPIPLLLQHERQRQPQARFVIYDQDGFHAFPSSGSQTVKTTPFSGLLSVTISP
ncbi:MAG: hypothetical protein HND47_19820 [Chloroflexi bacterium]|nr:hypothetical protein [Chloroflexota bacterium]